MKYWKLNLYEALIERLVNLASLEGSPRFQDVYLVALRDAVEKRTELRRRCNIHCDPLAPVQPERGCCTRNA